MPNCSKCNWKYPSSLLSPLVSTEKEARLVCGICALEIMNAETGITRDKFSGMMAESIRLAAIKWRKNHPQDRPTP